VRTGRDKNRRTVKNNNLTNGKQKKDMSYNEYLENEDREERSRRKKKTSGNDTIKPSSKNLLCTVEEADS